MIETPMNFKALARFLYANVPGLAAARFAAMDLTAWYFPKPEFAGVGRLLIADGLIVDIGANRGQSIAAFKRFAPKSKIIAFEPEIKSAQRLVLRYRRDPSVSIHRCALGPDSGSVTFFVPRYGRWDCDGMAATDRRAATDWLSDPGRMFLFDNSKLTVEEHVTECRTLDSYELTPALIKLHAQGAEIAILKGSKSTIRRHRPALMCAFPSVELTEMIAAWGYHPHAYYNEHFIPGIAKRPVTFTWYLTDDHMRQVPIRT
jgi:FkbM family methyltransferase